MLNNDGYNQNIIGIHSNNAEKMLDENETIPQIKPKNDINDFKFTHVEVIKITKILIKIF